MENIGKESVLRIAIDARESGTSTGRYIDRLIEYLHKLEPGYQIVVLTKRYRLDYLRGIAPGFEIIETPYKEFTFGEQLGFRAQLVKLQPDLVHFAMVQQPVFYRGKVVTTMHDLTTIRFKNPSKNQIIFTTKQQVYKFVNRVVARKSAAIITPTQFVKDDVAKFTKVNPNKIIVIHEAADTIQEPSKPIENLKGAEFIVYVGRPQPHKNLRRLIDAFALLKKSHPNLKLALAGKNDELYSRHEQYVHRQGIKDVVFTGFVSEGELRWLYEKCQAYIFPSLSEGFGLPGLEAMAHGAPVISSNATCLPEIYQDAAYYFDPTNIEAIANAIDNVLIDKSLRADLIKKGHEQVKKYSWRCMAEQTLAVYEQVLGNK